MKAAERSDQPLLLIDDLPSSLPLLPLDDRVVFPNVVVPVMVPEGSFSQLVEENISDSQLVALGYSTASPETERGGERKSDPGALPITRDGMCERPTGECAPRSPALRTAVAVTQASKLPAGE